MLSIEILDENVGGDMSSSKWFPELQAPIYLTIESSSPLQGPEGGKKKKKRRGQSCSKVKRKREKGKGVHVGQRVTEEETREENKTRKVKSKMGEGRAGKKQIYQ